MSTGHSVIEYLPKPIRRLYYDWYERFTPRDRQREHQN